MSGYSSSDLDCLLPHLSWQSERERVAGTAKPELPVDCWEIQQMDEDLFVDAAAWSLFVEAECFV